MKEEDVFTQFKIIADKKKKTNGMVSRQDIMNSVIELSVSRCLSIKNGSPGQLTEYRIKEEVFFISRTMQKMFQYPDEMIADFILPNVKRQLG